MTKVTTELRTRVIILMLAGYSRDEVAKQSGLSQGSVSNIFKEFTMEVGEANAEVLKNFGKFLREKGVDISDSVIGFRIKGILNKLGIDDEDLYSFIEKIYNECTTKGIDPPIIITSVEKLLGIQKNTKIPFDEIPQKYSKILKKIEEIERQLDEIEVRKTKAQKELNDILKKNSITIEQLNDWIHWHNELKKMGANVNDIPQVAKAIKYTKELGYDSKKITDHVSAEEEFQTRIAN